MDADGRLDGLELYQSVLHGLYDQLDRMTKETAEEKEEIQQRILRRLVR